MERRRFVALIAGALAAPFAIAQQRAKMPVLGILNPNPRPAPEQAARTPLMLRLNELGWTEGQNLAVERAYAEGKFERLPELAAALVAKRVDVIWAHAPEGSVAAARATKTIPIVFANATFPVELGLADSLSRPGRNATGVAYYGYLDQAAKPLEFLKAIAPGQMRLASIWTPANLYTVAGAEFTGAYAPWENAVRGLGYELRIHNVQKPDEYDRAFAAIIETRAQAVIALLSPMNWLARGRIVEFANRNGIATVFDGKAPVEIGGLVSYGPDVSDNQRLSAYHVDKILRGARPADLPVELPSKYELAVNLKTAKLLGLTVPQSVLLRADRVIE